MNSSSFNPEERRGQIAACLLAASLWAGANLMPLNQEPENVYAQPARARNSGFGGQFGTDHHDAQTPALNDVTNFVSPEAAKLDLYWEIATAAIAKTGSDPTAARPLFDAIIDFLRARSIDLAAVSARNTNDEEDGVVCAAIRFLIRWPFEEAMELDWEMTGHVLENHRFPENVTMSIRSVV